MRIMRFLERFLCNEPEYWRFTQFDGTDIGPEEVWGGCIQIKGDDEI